MLFFIFREERFFLFYENGTQRNEKAAERRGTTRNDSGTTAERQRNDSGTTRNDTERQRNDSAEFHFDDGMHFLKKNIGFLRKKGKS